MGVTPPLRIAVLELARRGVVDPEVIACRLGVSVADVARELAEFAHAVQSDGEGAGG